MQPTLASNSLSSSLRVPSVGITPISSAYLSYEAHQNTCNLQVEPPGSEMLGTTSVSDLGTFAYELLGDGT